MLKSGRETTNEKLNASINLTNSVAALCYEHLSTTLRIPAGFQSLVDDIGGFLRILRAVNLRKIGASEFGLAICECVKHMTWLRRRLGGKRMKRWKSSDVAEYRRRIERLRMLWETAAAEMDQLPTPKVIDAHISGTIFEKGPLLYDYDYELEVLARGKREKVLNWLYPEPYDKRHLEIKSRRNDNIGKWFFTSHEAQKWIKNKHAVSLLWGRSYAGSGKTFLSSLIIDTIKDHTPQGSVGVAYIYFNYKDQAQQRPAQVFASMIRQFSDQLPKLPVEVADLYGKLDSENRRPTATQLFTLLITVVESFDYAYVIWDAFDECDRVLQRKQLIPLFQRMAQSGSFRLFVTSRIGILAEDKGQDIFSAFGLAIKIHISARDEDIRTYIEEKIKENPRFQRLIRIGNYGERIVSELQICSRKLFLQVDLHIEYLCQQPTLRKVLIELEKLNPYTDNRNDVLAQSLNLALNTLLNQTKTLVKLAIKTLSWLVKAQRTFTIRELKQAISVEPGHYKLDESAIPDDETLIDVCAGLVVIDGDTVRLSHKSVHEYLVENALIPQNAEEDIAMACITFLSYHDFSRGACGHTLLLEIRRKMYPFMDYAAKNLGFHLQSCDENITIDPLSYFIEHQGRLASYLQALKAHNSYSKDSGYNIRYIKRTPLHVAASLGHSSLVRLLLERGATDLDTKSTSYSIGDRSAIHCATNAGHASIVRMLLQRGTNVSEAIDGEKALLTAACGGWGSTVKLLLEEGADISDVGYDGDTALHRAASNGHLEVARILLDKGLSLSVKARDGMTALHRAASLGHDSVVELLLDRGANISSTGDNRETALHQAAYGGHRGVVEMLLRGGANISATKTYGETPLHCAASGGHEQVVQLLLDRGADVGASAVKNGGETALHQAASEGFKMVVRALIDSGADIEVKTRYGVSVLQRAAHGGHTSVVRFLLDKGADVSAATKYGVTALHRAASAGHEATVQLLLERGAIHSAFDSDGETALHGAAAGGHYYVVKLLMEHGAKIDELTKNTGETALHKAAFGGHRLLVDFLLQVGANRLASAKDGSIPLHRAASCGHGSVARALLKDLAEHQVSAAKHNGETPIHCATFGGYDSIVTLLIESGAEVSKRNYRGETALHVAAYGGHISTAFILLDHGARVTDKTDYSENTIDRARAAGHTKLRDLLQNELS